VEAAHERGLKVIIDLVLAHTSDQHAILCIFNFSNHEAIQELEAEWQPIAEAGFRSSLDSGRVYLHPFGAWFGAARLSHG
jgi:glycosidase